MSNLVNPYHAGRPVDGPEMFFGRDDALIWVERQSQKSIVIGRQGAVLREVGQQARLEIEKMLDSKVNLKLWVKVREGWADDDRALKSLGYSDDD